MDRPLEEELKLLLPRPLIMLSPGITMASTLTRKGRRFLEKSVKDTAEASYVSRANTQRGRLYASG